MSQVFIKAFGYHYLQTLQPIEFMFGMMIHNYIFIKHQTLYAEPYPPLVYLKVEEYLC